MLCSGQFSFLFLLLFDSFEYDVCAREHLSCVIHLHSDLLYIFFQEKRNNKRKRKSNQAKFIFHFHSYELLIVTTLGATLFPIVVFSLSLSLVIEDVMPISVLKEYNGCRHVGIVSLSSFYCHSILIFNRRREHTQERKRESKVIYSLLLFFYFAWKILQSISEDYRPMQTSNFNRTCMHM